ncbi:outer membrane protein OprM precursor [Janthinobacterium lividum]|nr:outer membrane protein OprM precursor [Janthinobacterium lividum]
MSRMIHLNTRHAAPLLAAAMLALAGCSVGTPTATRALDTAQLPVLPSAAGAPELQAGAPPARWWQELGDARLEQLVQRAWQDNYDVRIATARLASANEFAQAARGARLPAVDLDAQAGRARLAAIESSDGQPHIASPVQWNAVFSWELDLFGRVRHSIAAAEASADERAAVRDDVRRLILAQVVDAYLVLRGAQQMRASLQEQLSNQSGTLRLVRERENAGRAAPAERMRAEAQMRLASARLPSLNFDERVARNRLATLTGQRLDAPELAALDQPMPLALPQSLLTDEPAHLLLRRPDVRAAERALAAASAIRSASSWARCSAPPAWPATGMAAMRRAGMRAPPFPCRCSMAARAAPARAQPAPKCWPRRPASTRRWRWHWRKPTAPSRNGYSCAAATRNCARRTSWRRRARAWQGCATRKARKACSACSKRNVLRWPRRSSW